MSEIVYSKYANERAPQFALRTDIVRNDKDVLVVHKTPLCQEASDHVKNIYAFGEALNKQYANSRFAFNNCQETLTGVELEFIDGVSLEQIADKLLYAGKVDEVEKLLLEVIKELYKTKGNKEFQKTAEFVKVFGEVDLAPDLPCMPISDIDMIMSNIMQGDKWTVLDYEWSFDFPIPVQFIAYRLLHYYLYASPIRNVLRERNLMEKAGISTGTEEIYYQMERHFQDIYVLQELDGRHYTPLRELYADITAGSVDVRELYQKIKDLGRTEEERKNPVLAFGNVEQENQRLQDKLKAKEAQITAMENTKVWKAYRKYKDLREK